VSKIYSRFSSRSVGVFMCLSVSACAVPPQAPSSSPSPGSPSSGPIVQQSDQTLPRQGNSPRALASLRFTEEARTLLERGNIDDAITTLERAMNLNPSDGQNYYYLAEAWLKKRNPSQAREFNRLAAMYLRDEPEWNNRVNDQKERITEWGVIEK
jgi:tetratricopeptide (TPR) repeat protein